MVTTLTLKFVRSDQGGAPRGFPLRKGTSYLLFVDRAPPVPFVCPLDQKTVDEFYHMVAAGKDDQDQLTGLGRALAQALTPAGVWATVNAKLALGGTLQLIIRSTASEIHVLPWEATLLPDGIHLGRSPRCLLLYEQLDKPAETPVGRSVFAGPEGGRVLFVSSARGGPIPRTFHQDSLAQAAGSSLCPKALAVQPIEAVSIRRLREACSQVDAPIAILHILCHGRLAEDGTYRLVWDGDGAGAQDELPGSELAGALAGRERLGLVLLLACHGGDPGPADNHLGSIAESLHRIDVPVVIASRTPISDAGSVLLTQQFYHSLLVESASAETSFHCARQLVGDSREAGLDWLGLQCWVHRPDDGISDHRPIVIRPYRGLDFFDEAHKGFFFGRDTERQLLLQKLLHVSTRGNRLLFIAAASGTGKSSLVRAGLIPDLRRARPDWGALVVRLGDAPVEGLWQRLAAYYGVPLPQDYVADPTQTLTTMRGGLSRPLLLVVDQFEEIFTQPLSQQVRDQYARLLWCLASDATAQVTVLLSLRIDYLGYCKELRLNDQGGRLDQVFGDSTVSGTQLLGAEQVEKLGNQPAEAAADGNLHRFLLASLGPKQIVEAITRPAALVGLCVPTDLAKRIAKDTDEGHGALPLMEFALDRLWERRQGRQLTDGVYLSLGEVAGSLEKAANACYESLSLAERWVARRILLAMVNSAEESAGETRRRIRIDAERPGGRSGKRFDKVLKALVDMRLVVRGELPKAPDDPIVAWAELSHDALIERWGLLRRWLREQRQAQARLRYYWALGALALVLSLTASGAGLALRWTAMQRTNQRLRLASLSSDPLPAALTLTTLKDESEPPDGLSTAWKVATERHPRVVLPYRSIKPATHSLSVKFNNTGFESIAFSPDDRHIFLAQSDGAVVSWSTDGTGTPVVLSNNAPEGDTINTLDVSPNGNWVLSVGESGNCQVARADGQGPAYDLATREGQVIGAAFVQGDRLLVGYADGHIAAWTAGQSVTRIAGVVRPSGTPLKKLVFNPDGKWLVAVSANWKTPGQLQRIDGADTVLLEPPTGQENPQPFGRAEFYRNGDVLYVRSELWSAFWIRTSGTDTWSRKIRPEGSTLFPRSSRGKTEELSLCNAYSEDLTQALSFTGQASLHLERTFLSTELKMGSDFVNPTAPSRFSHNGALAASASGNGKVRIWSTLGDNLVRAGDSDGDPLSVDLSADGKYLLLDQQGSVTLSSLYGESQTTRLSQPGQPARFAVFVGSGWDQTDRRFVQLSISDYPHKSMLIPVAAPAERSEFSRPYPPLIPIAISHDGRRQLDTDQMGTRLRIRFLGSEEWEVLPERFPGVITEAAFTPDDRRVWVIYAKSAYGESAMLYDLRTKKGEQLFSRLTNSTVLAGGWGVVAAEVNVGVRMYRVGGFDALVKSTLSFEAGVHPQILSLKSTGKQQQVIALTDQALYVNRGETLAPVFTHEIYPDWDPRQATIVTSFDGRFLTWLSANPSTIRVFPLATKDAPILLPVWDQVRRLAFKGDDSEIITVSDNGTVRRWPMTWRGLLAYLDDSTTACLTVEERKLFLQENAQTADKRFSECEKNHNRSHVKK